MSQCYECGQEQTTQTYMCEKCQKRVQRQLAEIPILHSTLSGNAWMKLPAQHLEEKTSRQVSTGAPADLYLLGLVDRRTDARAVLGATLAHWRFSIPPDLASICSRLSDLLPWAAAEYSDITDFAHDVRHQHSKLDRAVNGGRRPPKPVPCPVFLPDTGQCSGHLYLHADGTVTCERCGSVWHFDDWRRLGALFASDAPDSVQ